MKKNYVYKVRANGMVYDNLASAIESCAEDLRLCACGRISKPMIVKIYGGYQVIVIDMNGQMFKRGIDVFVPKHLVDKVDYYIDDEFVEQEDINEEEEDDDYDDDYDDEEEEDDDYSCCDNCGEEFDNDELVDIDHSFKCKDCALDYINAYKSEDDILCEENTICEHCGKVIEKLENYFFVDDCDLCRECAKEYIEEQY